MKIFVVGGGFGGCAAALQAAMAGAQVILSERTDMLGGTGLVGGIMRNNGRYTAAEEMIAMGGGRLFELIDENCRHKNVDFPGHRHASLFDVGKISGVLHRCLLDAGVKILYETRICGVKLVKGRLLSVEDAHGNRYEADAFVDATGTGGPANICSKYGSGCAMCVLRCPVFGGRQSLCELCHVKEYAGLRGNGLQADQKTWTQIEQVVHEEWRGAMSGSCKLLKASLDETLVRQLETLGAAVVPVPEGLQENHLEQKACQQYALPEYAHNLVLLDTGHAKLMTPWFPLQKLRQIPGFENARFEDPYGGGRGNSVRFTAMAPRDDTMKVDGLENVFCAGEKAGLLVGHTEAIVTGTLAGHNACRLVSGLKPDIIPRALACGDGIYVSRMAVNSREGLSKKYTFSGSVLFERMKARGCYLTDPETIKDRVRAVGAENMFKP